MNADKLSSLLRIVFIICIIFVLTFSLWVSSPIYARKIKEDANKVILMFDINKNINSYLRKNGDLPKSFDDLYDNKDKLNNIKYVRTNMGSSFKLCSDFNFREKVKIICKGCNYPGDMDYRFYQHGSGYYCYNINCMKNYYGVECHPVHDNE